MFSIDAVDYIKIQGEQGILYCLFIDIWIEWLSFVNIDKKFEIYKTALMLTLDIELQNYGFFSISLNKTICLTYTYEIHKYLFLIWKCSYISINDFKCLKWVISV